jgi:hypothetical protein
MRTITTLVIIGTALAACTVKNTTVKQAETPPPVVYQQPPVVYQQATAGRPATVAYTVIGQEQLNQALVKSLKNLPGPTMAPACVWSIGPTVPRATS